MAELKKQRKKKTSKIPEEEIIEQTGPDEKNSERIFNYKVSSEITREIEIKGISFIAKFYKTTSNTQGIRIPLSDNGLLFKKFYEYALKIEDERIPKEKEANLMAFTTFGKMDKGLEFFPVMGFYIYPFKLKNKEPHLVFNEEKDSPKPMERLEEFIDYFRKKFRIKVRPKKSTFDSLRALDLTEI